MFVQDMKDCEKTTIDLHGLRVEQAEEELVVFLDGLPKTIKAVEVTHGYSHGTALKRMVKQDFYHWRVVDKQAGYNPGATWLLLK